MPGSAGSGQEWGKGEQGGFLQYSREHGLTVNQMPGLQNTFLPF